MKWRVILYSLIALFLLTEIAIFLPDYDEPRMVKFIVISQILMLLSVGIFLAGKKLQIAAGMARHVWIVVLLAVVARTVMLIGAGDKFYISDDIYRYVWDAKVNAAGINPYLHAPDSDSLRAYREGEIFGQINHNWLPTIYPPMAQNIFFVVYLLGGENLFAFKLVTAFFELLTCLALFVLAREWGIPPANLLLYLFSPLVLIEFYLSNHLDILALPFLVAGLITLKRRQALLTGMLLGLATLVKFFGLFFLPVVFFHLKGKEKLHFAAAFVVTAVALYLPYIADGGLSVFGSLFEYLQEWQFNASVYFVLKYFLKVEIARYLVAGAFVVWVGWLLARKLPIERKLQDTFGGYMVLTPTLFPWYFVWIYPMLLRTLSPAFIYLSGALLLSYHVHIGYYDTGTWSPMPWLGIAAYVPFYALLVGVTLFRRVRLKVQ